MSNPLFYILAPFGLAFALFAVFLIVSIFLKDPARPFRMFGAPPLDLRDENQEASPESRVQSAEETDDQEPSTFAKASVDMESRSQESGEEQEY
jgi:hypothetical protein